jgi:hypothetical protein
MSDFAQAQYQFGPGQSVALASHGDDNGLFAEFRIEAVHNPAKSREEGRAIFEDKEYITIHFPGDKTKKIDRPVQFEDDNGVPSDPARFPKQYARFKAQEEQAGDGLPVQQWPVLSKSQALEFKAMGIHTVEQLAGLPDTALNWLGARELRTQAQAWLDKAGAHAAESRLAAENAQLRERMAAMEQQIKDLADQAKKSATKAKGE